MGRKTEATGRGPGEKVGFQQKLKIVDALRSNAGAFASNPPSADYAAQWVREQTGITVGTSMIRALTADGVLGFTLASGRQIPATTGGAALPAAVEIDTIRRATADLATLRNQDGERFERIENRLRQLESQLASGNGVAQRLLGR